MKLSVTLTPMGAYFLGTERNATHAGETNSQLSEAKPYFIRSAQYPAQSALFGILRYVGIKNPNSSYSIQSDIDNIGAESFDLLSNEQTFGKIKSIGPLTLVDKNDNHYIPAPRGHMSAEWEVIEGGLDYAEFKPFRCFSKVKTLEDDRFYPVEYNEKKARDEAELFCLEDKRLYKSPFSTKVQVGINRQSQRVDEEKREVSGFFKKEYVLLNCNFSFQFTAEVEDDFWYHENTVAYVGQGRTPFAVKIAKASEPTPFPEIVLPDTVTVNGKDSTVCYEIALSDCYYSGKVADLKRLCSFMIAEPRDYRVFTTNYQGGKRYRKHENGLKLLKAGSVFYFFGTKEMTPVEQRQAFRESLKHVQPQTAGFNQLYFQLKEENHHENAVL